jgi:hypothetical protein
MGFPMNPPLQAIDHIIEYLKGNSEHEIGGLVEDAYDILGYGLYLGFGTHESTGRLMATGEPNFAGGEEVKNQAVIQELENMKGARKGAAVQTWVLMYVWTLIQKAITDYLNSKQGHSHQTANMGQQTMSDLQASGVSQLKPENTLEVGKKADEAKLQEAKLQEAKKAEEAKKEEVK